jgi:peptide/histidine transporter 3/4
VHVQAEAQRTDIHADRFNLTGDGSVDKYGHLADKHKTGGWRAAPLIFGTEICERMATLGLQRNLVTYFTKKIHMTNPQAANTVSNFVGTLYLTPFVGGFVADGESASFLVVSRQVHRTSQAVFSAD